MQDPDRTSHTLTCHQNSREAANAKKKREVKSRGSVVECGSLHRFGTCQKAAGTATLQDAPATHPGRLAKRIPLDSFSFTEKVAGVQKRVPSAGKNAVAT